jgi:MoaA/NifB/PqqE/SkfB family radical SAM enzyme
METTSPNETIATQQECHMYWHMLTECNFRCEYCFRQAGAPHPAGHTVVTAEQIAGRFDETGKLWHIYMTGGEPLLYPDFVGIVRALTQRHHLFLSTNLSTSNAWALADSVDPGRVLSVEVSLHIQERDRRGEDLDELLRKVRHFQLRGFNVRLSYVAWPPLMGRMADDVARLRDGGVKLVVVKPFQGKYDSRRYPRDYTTAERDMIERLGMSDSSRRILEQKVSFLGRKCVAGYRAFVMDTAGEVRRCSSLGDRYGNLFDGTFAPGECPRRCTARRCGCTYQGLRFAQGGPFSVPSHIIATPAEFLLSLNDRLARL